MSKHWAPHGPVLTACLVAINVLMILLIFFYFWQFFSGERGPPSGADEEEASSADSSPASSPRTSGRLCQPDVASSLAPASVYVSAGEAPAEGCAVCIAEFRDGDLARLLPRCGHRFHAACLDAWLHRHSTCPLCRASIATPAKNVDDPRDDGVDPS